MDVTARRELQHSNREPTTTAAPYVYNLNSRKLLFLREAYAWVSGGWEDGNSIEFPILLNSRKLG